MTDDTDVSWIRSTHNLIPASKVQLLRFNVCWLVKDYQMCPLFKICLVASFLSRGAVIHNQKWTRKTNHVSEPLCRHYRNDVTYGHQELGTLTLFFYTKKSPIRTYMTLKLRLDNDEVPKTNLTHAQYNRPNQIILLWQPLSIQNDFCFWKRRVLFLSVYFSSTSHTIKWSCRKNRKTVQYSYKGFWFRNRLLDGM